MWKGENGNGNEIYRFYRDLSLSNINFTPTCPIFSTCIPSLALFDLRFPLYFHCFLCRWIERHNYGTPLIVCSLAPFLPLSISLSLTLSTCDVLSFAFPPFSLSLDKKAQLWNTSHSLLPCTFSTFVPLTLSSCDLFFVVFQFFAVYFSFTRGQRSRITKQVCLGFFLS